MKKNTNTQYTDTQIIRMKSNTFKVIRMDKKNPIELMLNNSINTFKKGIDFSYDILKKVENVYFPKPIKVAKAIEMPNYMIETLQKIKYIG